MGRAFSWISECGGSVALVQSAEAAFARATTTCDAAGVELYPVRPWYLNSVTDGAVSEVYCHAYGYQA